MGLPNGTHSIATKLSRKEEKMKPEIGREVSSPEFPYEEFELRINKARELMGKHGIEALLLFSPLHMRYYIGFRKASYGSSELWRRLLILPREKDPIFIPANIVHRLAMKITWVKDIRPWGGPDYLGFSKDYRTILFDAIKELGLDRKKIGVEVFDSNTAIDLSFPEWEKIKTGLPNVQFVDGSPVYWEQRQVKTQYEQKIIRELCAILVKGVNAGLNFLREGVSEIDVHQVMWKTFLEAGLHDCPMGGRIMQHGGKHRYDLMIVPPTNYVLQKGDQYFIDGGPRHKGYFCDIQRNLCIGPPPELEAKLYNAANEATEAAIQAVKPGAKASDIWKAAMKVLKDKYPSTEDPIKFVGHGMGLQTHEPPYLMEDNDTAINPGMFLAVEVWAADIPEYRVIGGFPEDNLLVTEDGFENLTAGVSRELWIK
jgi:Xaa-Pro aminopeptidase